MASSEVAICNSALIKIGAAEITSLSDVNKRAQLCNEQYSKLRDELLRIATVSVTGCLVYLLATFALNSPEIKIFKNLLLKKFSDKN